MSKIWVTRVELREMVRRMVETEEMCSECGCPMAECSCPRESVKPKAPRESKGGKKVKQGKS